MSRRGATNINWAFALAAALVLCSALVPAIAQAPDKQIIRPVAACADGKCVMSQADFERLQKFHADRMAALLMAAEVMDNLQGENAQLRRLLARVAAGCQMRGT